VKLDKLAGRVAERDDSPKWHAVLWVAFWGVKSVWLRLRSATGLRLRSATEEGWHRRL